MTSVSIDFVAGSHGNFLEYVCNKFIAKVPITDGPFTDLGTSHNKNQSYYDHAVFRAMHYSEFQLPTKDDVIRITFGQDDLLILSSVSLFRAGDTGIDNNMLEHNTYHKLNNKLYRNLIDTINSAYPEYAISSLIPDCPRFILREFFKFGFRDPGVHGFLQKMEQITNSSAKNVFDFPFSTFYNSEMFLNKINALAKWFGELNIDNLSIQQLHADFLSKNTYTDHKEISDTIISAIKNKRYTPIPKLTLFQESYINGVLEHTYPGLEMPFMQNEYFKNTKDIIEYINV